MRRVCVLGGFLALALCGAAQAQVETVVVTASLAGPRASAFIRAAQARLTPDGKTFVEREAGRLRDGALGTADVRAEATDNCAAAFGACGNRDAQALTAIVFERTVMISIGAGGRLFDGLPQSQTEAMNQKTIACMERNDMKCAKKAFLSVLPPDRRHAFDRLNRRARRIRKALSEALAEAGFDPKDDK